MDEEYVFPETFQPILPRRLQYVALVLVHITVMLSWGLAAYWISLQFLEGAFCLPFISAGTWLGYELVNEVKKSIRKGALVNPLY